MDVLLEGVLVLLLLVQHVLLLGLLQGPLINVPPVHLLQLLALLKGKQGTQMGRSRARPMQGRQQTHICPKVSGAGRAPREEQCP